MTKNIQIISIFIFIILFIGSHRREKQQKKGCSYIRKSIRKTCKTTVLGNKI